MNKYKFWVIFGAVMAVVYAVARVAGGKYIPDYRVAIIRDKEIELRSYSIPRRMENRLMVSGEVRLWIPNGLGWYETDKISRLLTQEKKRELMSKVLFANFGFWPTRVIWQEPAGGLNEVGLGVGWGWGNLARYWWQDMQSGSLVKEERLSSQLTPMSEKLVTVLSRDFADSRIIEESINASIINRGTANGLAGFVARELELAGMMVTDTSSTNYTANADVSCKVRFGSGLKDSVTIDFLATALDGCLVEEDSALGKTVEISLGDDYARVINYQSYNTRN